MAIVRKARLASPEKRLPTLAPPCQQAVAVRDAPLDLGGVGRVVRDEQPSVSFSYQRKAGMPSLLPCRMPAWLAEVWEGSIAVQPSRRWLPWRTQPLITGTRPARTWRRMTG